MAPSKYVKTFYFFIYLNFPFEQTVLKIFSIRPLVILVYVSTLFLIRSLTLIIFLNEISPAKSLLYHLPSPGYCTLELSITKQILNHWSTVDTYDYIFFCNGYINLYTCVLAYIKQLIYLLFNVSGGWTALSISLTSQRSGVLYLGMWSCNRYEIVVETVNLMIINKVLSSISMIVKRCIQTSTK